MKKISIASFLSRLSQHERFVFYGAAFIVGVALLDQLILSPILSKINRLNEDITIFKETVQKNIVIISQEERILEERKHYAPYLSRPQSEEKEVTTFLKEIETEAKDSSVYLVDIRPSGQTEEGSSKQYFLEIEFEAQLEQVLRFFHAIETADKLFKIERYRIRPKTEGSRIAACSASVSKTIIPK
jgi:Tfp pilus assembly protein PilO